jgi:phospholipase C
MPPLTNRDGAANNLHAQLSTTPRPNNDCPLTLPNPVPDPPVVSLAAVSPLERSQQPLPESGNLGSFLAISLKTDLELADSEAERAAILAKFETIRTRGEAKAYAEEVGAKAEKARAARAC